MLVQASPLIFTVALVFPLPFFCFFISEKRKWDLARPDLTGTHLGSEAGAAVGTAEEGRAAPPCGSLDLGESTAVTQRHGRDVFPWDSGQPFCVTSRAEPRAAWGPSPPPRGAVPDCSWQPLWGAHVPHFGVCNTALHGALCSPSHCPPCHCELSHGLWEPGQAMHDSVSDLNKAREQRGNVNGKKQKSEEVFYASVTTIS